MVYIVIAFDSSIKVIENGYKIVCMDVLGRHMHADLNYVSDSLKDDVWCFFILSVFYNLILS